MRISRKLAERFGRLVATAVVGTSAIAAASTPDWLRQAVQAPLPAYPPDTKAVLLLDESAITVSPSGEVHQTYRKAYKILRPQARSLGLVTVYFDSETQLTFLKGWSITAKSGEYEVKEKDAIETTVLSESLYSDTRYKLLAIPGAQPGSVIGYEYQQKQRPSIFQSIWSFQSDIPVRHARLTLELPPKWSFHPYWRNHPPVDAHQDGENRWSWQLTDISAIQSEPQMPSWQSVAGSLGISVSPNGSDQGYGSWDQVAHWYWNVASTRREVTPPIRAKVRELTAGATDDLERIHRLASYVQHGIRYVAVEIGIGGYQPHPAQQVLASGYGDCKDKATLLSAMLTEIGIGSYYLLVNDDRDYLAPDFPSPLGFNHVILGIHLPDNVVQQSFFAKLDYPKLGRLLLFDPTDTSIDFGTLPPSLQGAHALLVSESNGDLVTLPLLPAATNRLLRTGTLTLDESGTLKGAVQEVRSGSLATTLVERLRTLPTAQRQKVFEDLLSELIDGAVLTQAGVSDLKNFKDSLLITYSFTMAGYGQRAGDLFLFRPCAVCRKPPEVMEAKPRRYPVAFSFPISESDVFDISYPSDFAVEELPQAVSFQLAFADYKSELKNDEHVLHYQRTYELKDVRVSLDHVDDLKNFFRQVGNDQGAYIVLKSKVRTAK